MILAVDFSTLPFEDPVLKFLIVLVIILAAPLLLNKVKIPHLIGLIIAGAAIGPNGFGILPRDSNIVVTGTTGLLYIMFLAGLEIDLAEFKKNSTKSLVFGMATFLVPMSIGTLAGYYLLDFNLMTSVLLASMFASHTLLSYPLISKLGVAKDKAVNITVGGTMITDTLALIVLAVIVGMTQGEVNAEFWLRLGISIVIFGAIVLFGFPIIGRWFFKNVEDKISQYIFVLVMVFFGALLAEIAGIEAIIGAFLAGLALNRLIPHTSPLMNRVEFVGNAYFIPFFLISVGMLIDFTAFFKDFETIKVAVVMTLIALLSKYIAAWVTQKIYKLSKPQRGIIFGLSAAQAAATLAAVLVGYNIIISETETGEPIRLLSESVLNGTILMILVTSTVSSFVSQKNAQLLAGEQQTDQPDSEHHGNILVALDQDELTDDVINLGLNLKSGNDQEIIALHVIEEHAGEEQIKSGRKALDHAKKIGASSDVEIKEIVRHDINYKKGITAVIKESSINETIIGIDKVNGLSNNCVANIQEIVNENPNKTFYLYKALQPMATLKKMVIVIPEHAEREPNFLIWLHKIWKIAKNMGVKITFFAHPNAISILETITSKVSGDNDIKELPSLDDFLVINKDLTENSLLVVPMSRVNQSFYQNYMEKIPRLLDYYFKDSGYLLVYPEQNSETHHDTNRRVLVNPSDLANLGKQIKKLFK